MTLSLTLLWANAWFLQPFYTFSSAHRRMIRGTFILTFLCFSVTVFQQALRFWAGIFYPQVFFTLHSFLTFLSRFVTQMWAGTPHPRSFSVPTLTELSLPADAWSWTTHIVDTRPLVYQLRQFATKYRVKTKLMDMFACSKSYGKTIKTISTRLNKWYCL